MFRWLRKKISAFSDDRGAITVEYAFVAIPFIGLVVAIVQSFLEQLFVSELDRGVQLFAADMRSGVVMLKDVNTRALLETAIKNRICTSSPILRGFNCTKLQAQLYNNASCATSGSTSCWASQYSDFAKGVRKAPTYSNAPSFTVGLAGASQYLTVYYPFPKMSAIWNTAPTAIVNNEQVYGILATATWINDPSVGVF